MGLAERQELIELVLSVARERGLTLIFVEHGIDAVFRAAESITVMAQGQVFAEGAPDETPKRDLLPADRGHFSGDYPREGRCGGRLSNISQAMQPEHIPSENDEPGDDDSVSSPSLDVARVPDS